MEEIGGNRYKLDWERLHLDIKYLFFIVRTNIHCNNLPRDVVRSPPLEVFKMQPERVLVNLI